MPKAFCGLEMCAKNLRELCALCERKNSPACCLCVVSYSGSILFLTENTEEQNTQRSTETLSQPITQNLTAIFSKSSTPNTHHPTPVLANHQHLTTITQHPSAPHPLPHSFQEHALLHSRTCPLTSKNTPFLMLDKALLQRSLQHLDFMYVTETDKAYILNGKLIYKDRMIERHIMPE